MDQVKYSMGQLQLAANYYAASETCSPFKFIYLFLSFFGEII